MEGLRALEEKKKPRRLDFGGGDKLRNGLNTMILALKLTPPIQPLIVSPFSRGLEGSSACMAVMKPVCHFGKAAKSRS